LSSRVKHSNVPAKRSQEETERRRIEDTVGPDGEINDGVLGEVELVDAEQPQAEEAKDDGACQACGREDGYGGLCDRQDDSG